MTNIYPLLRDLLRRGAAVRLDLESGRLVINAPPNVVTAADLAALRQCKEKAIALLARADQEEARALRLLDQVADALRAGRPGANVGTPSRIRVLSLYRDTIRSHRASLDTGLFFAVASVRQLAGRWGVALAPEGVPA